uniref:MFS domain-containing protein n=1 Tax=Heterorhabditis bacteriophora TaxID=37862 RepID=A0A1I7X8C8_HETBA
MSATYPTILGLIIASLLLFKGQCMYGLLPLFHSHQKWMMIIARFITGIGAGSKAIVDSYH